MTLPIRYSPSGPIISSPAGAPAVPGVGFQLRLVDAMTSVGNLAFSSAADDPIPAASGPFILEIANPKPTLRYSVEAFVVVSGTTGTVEWGFGSIWRIDGGAWSSVTGGRCNVPGGSSAQPRQVNIAQPAVLGSALPAPVLADSTLLEVQLTATVLSGNPSITAGGSIYARLIEAW